VFVRAHARARGIEAEKLQQSFAFISYATNQCMFWGPNRWGCELNENVAPSPFKEFAAVATKTFASPR
jgi:hypothetical protein